MKRTVVHFPTTLYQAPTDHTSCLNIYERTIPIVNGCSLSCIFFSSELKSVHLSGELNVNVNDL